MPYRSYDFERIHSEFLNCYPSREEAEREYYSWLKDLSLDESREYGQARESYLWRKEDLQFVREDAEAKYYEVEVGFPTKSMNGNVYRKRDLVAAALTLKGKHPSLNHKVEFWFSPKNPRNRWGNIEILDGKFHEGICKALVRVPKTAVCPICNGKPMTELIDSKRIVNVSLEGDCARGRCYDGTCEGFYFTDPPFTFLTTDVLPGIPMTRIKPLEAYMPVSQSSIHKIRGKIIEKENKTLKIKPKIIEETPEKDNTTVNTKTVGTDFRGTFGTPIQSDAELHSITTSKHTGTVEVGVDNEKQMQSGYAAAMAKPITPRTAEARMMEPFADYADFADCVAKNSDKDDPEAYCASIKQQTESKRKEEQAPDFAGKNYAPMDGPSDDEKQPKPEDIKTGPPKTKPPEDSDMPMPVGVPATFPAITKPETEVGEQPPKADDKVVTGDTPAVEQADEPTMECPDGYHKDAEGNCVPDTDAAESIRRIKAEYEAEGLRKNIKFVESVWADRFTKLKEQYQKVVNVGLKKDAVITELRMNKRQIEEKLDKFQEQNGKAVQELRIELEDYKGRYGGATRESAKFSKLVEELQIENEDLKRKYHGALSTNLKLSKDVTKANEDYLAVAQDKEKLQEALTRSRNEAKKILKIKA